MTAPGILSCHDCTRNFAKSPCQVHPSKSLDGRRKGANQLVNLIRSSVSPSNQDNLISLGQRSSNLSSNLRQSFQHQGHDGSISILFVGRGFHSHTLSLSSSNSFYSLGLSTSNKPDLLPISTSSFYSLGLSTSNKPDL